MVKYRQRVLLLCRSESVFRRAFSSFYSTPNLLQNTRSNSVFFQNNKPCSSGNCGDSTWSLRHMSSVTSAILLKSPHGLFSSSSSPSAHPQPPNILHTHPQSVSTFYHLYHFISHKKYLFVLRNSFDIS